MSSDQLSPNISSAMLIGQPERRCKRDLVFITGRYRGQLQFASHSGLSAIVSTRREDWAASALRFLPCLRCSPGRSRLCRSPQSTR
jgi:hypothetical protein